MKHIHTYEEFLNENLNEAKSPNADFVKLFKTAMSKFPTFSPNDYKTKEDILYGVIQLKNDLESGSYPRSYFGFDYSDIHKLSRIFKSYKLQEILTDGEKKTLQGICKPKYEDLIDNYLTDPKIEEVAKEQWIKSFPEKDYTDNSRFAIGIRLISDMPDLFNFIKKMLIDSQISSKDWQTLSVKSKRPRKKVL